MTGETADWQRAIDIAAQSLSNLSVDIAAQSINQLGVDIESQSVGNLAVDIAASSIGNVPISIEAQNITGGVPIDIEAQSLSNVAVDLAAQSVSQLDIDITAQSIGDVDTNFNNQSQGVNTGSEFAAAQGNVAFTLAQSTTVTAGNSATISSTNNSGQTRFVELLTVANLDGYADAINYQLEVNVAATDNFVVNVNHPELPIFFDPPLPWNDGEDTVIEIFNNSGSDFAFQPSLIYRT